MPYRRASIPNRVPAPRGLGTQPDTLAHGSLHTRSDSRSCRACAPPRKARTWEGQEQARGSGPNPACSPTRDPTSDRKGRAGSAHTRRRRQRPLVRRRRARASPPDGTPHARAVGANELPDPFSTCALRRARAHLRDRGGAADPVDVGEAADHRRGAAVDAEDAATHERRHWQDVECGADLGPGAGRALCHALRVEAVGHRHVGALVVAAQQEHAGVHAPKKVIL
jgi:hypothetical protein